MEDCIEMRKIVKVYLIFCLAIFCGLCILPLGILIKIIDGKSTIYEDNKILLFVEIILLLIALPSIPIYFKMVIDY